MKLYIPNIRDKLRLTTALIVSAGEVNLQYYDREDWFRIAHPDEPWDYAKAQRVAQIELEIGTVLAIRRYHVSIHAKTNDVQMSIFASPRRDLTPKANGGTGKMVKLTFPIEVMNRIEYERLEV